MGIHRIRRGVDLAISGPPEQIIHDGPAMDRVGVLSADFPGLKARLLVREGEQVLRGQPLLEDRSRAGVRLTAPAAGTVVAVNRAARRALESVVIELSTAERDGEIGEAESQRFDRYTGRSPATLDGHDVRGLLLESGAWAAFRARPFGRIPGADDTPAAIFVTASDSNPLAAQPDVVLRDQAEEFDLGLRLISELTGGTTYLCVGKDSTIPEMVTAPVSIEEFRGPHPSGTAGLHVHLLEPVSRQRSVWTIGYQDVTAVARLFLTGRFDVQRIFAVGGPPVRNPGLVRSRLGAAVNRLGVETEDSELRWISGSVLSGRESQGPIMGFMGWRDTQLSVLREGRAREFLGWLTPGRQRFSVLSVFFSKVPGSRGVLDFTTATHGGRRAMVPIGMYERVVPFDVLPTFLLRALAAGDYDRAEALGCLEWIEEDIALCSLVDTGKIDYAPLLRRALDTLELEG